jgi:hypothetical protein
MDLRSILLILCTLLAAACNSGGLDGRAYRLFILVDAFPKVECYRVDPAVYKADHFPQ